MIEVTTKALMQIKIYQLKKALCDLIIISNHPKVGGQLTQVIHLFIQNVSRKFRLYELCRKIPIVKAILTLFLETAVNK